MGYAYKFELWSHVSDVENHLSKRCLKWQTPLECFIGETPDLSVFRHRWYAPVWYKEKTAATGQAKLFQGQYIGLAWNVGEALCAKILTCLDKGRPQIIHGVYTLLELWAKLLSLISLNIQRISYGQKLKLILKYLGQPTWLLPLKAVKGWK